ncbi:hypothetical protein BH11GEM2_BH11GEM2_10650 [soil metagenome]
MTRVFSRMDSASRPAPVHLRLRGVGLRRLSWLILAAGAVACSNGPTGFNGDRPAVRVVNAFTGPVDVLIDGAIVAASLSAGAISSVYAPYGAHTLMIRPAGSATTSASQTIVTASGALSTIAVVRSSSGSVATAVLDDTGSVVPAGATKVRVLHLAPNAGELQVYRTQPDYQTPVSWQFPFTYQAQPNSLSAPFYQSTVGSWEIHIWQTPVGASGWATAPVQIIIPLAGGEKKTVLILDKSGGGVRYELL